MQHLFISKYNLIYILWKPLTLPILMCKIICNIFKDFGNNQERRVSAFSCMLQKVVHNFANFLNRLCKFYFLMLRAFKQSIICENHLTGSWWNEWFCPASPNAVFRQSAWKLRQLVLKSGILPKTVKYWYRKSQKILTWLD